MNKKNMYLVLLGMLIVGGLMWWGKNNQSIASSSRSVRTQGGDSSASVLSAPERFYDFGTISMAKGETSHIFKIKNETGEDINLKNITTSCMCTVAYIVNGLSKKGPFGMPGHIAVPKANEIIRPGETRDIEVVYDPAAHGPAGVGLIDRLVYLTDFAGNTLQLEIKAVVTP